MKKKSLFIFLSLIKFGILVCFLISPTVALSQVSCKVLFSEDEQISLKETLASDKYLDKGGAWQTVKAPSLRGHIVKGHLNVLALYSLGIAKYDIDVAKRRGFDLDWVTLKIYEKLERSDQSIKDDIERLLYGVTDFSPTDYRKVLVKNLKYIEDSQISVIDWNRVEKSFPNARQVTYDLLKDVGDQEVNPNAE